MSNTYTLLEKEIEDLVNIKNWDEKIEKIKIFKEKINNEKNRLSELTDSIMKDKYDIKNKKANKTEKLTLDELIVLFENSNIVEEKIKIYNNINVYINNVEKQLFSS